MPGSKGTSPTRSRETSPIGESDNSNGRNTARLETRVGWGPEAYRHDAAWRSHSVTADESSRFSGNTTSSPSEVRQQLNPPDRTTREPAHRDSGPPPFHEIVTPRRPRESTIDYADRQADAILMSGFVENLAHARLLVFNNLLRSQEEKQAWMAEISNRLPDNIKASLSAIRY